MNYSDLSSKLTQVIEQIPKDVLYDFVVLMRRHEETAMALVNEFGGQRRMVAHSVANVSFHYDKALVYYVISMSLLCRIYVTNCCFTNIIIY